MPRAGDGGLSQRLLNCSVNSAAETANGAVVQTIGASPLVIPRNPTIEGRAVSAAFLRAFTDRYVVAHPDLARTATNEALAYLDKQIQEVQNKLTELVSPRADAGESASGTVLRRGTSAAIRSKMVLQQKLKVLQEDVAARKRKAFLSTRDVHKYIIKAETDARKCRWVELPGWGDGVDSSGAPFVGDADSFVSHSWDSPWERLVEAVCEHSQREGKSGKFYWVDIFAVNQHSPEKDEATQAVTCPTDCRGCAAIGEDLPDWETMQEHPTSKGFGRVLGFCKHVLVLMEPWHSPRPPTRVWCLFEMFNGISQSGGQVEVMLSRLEQQEMQVALADDFSKFEALIVGIDAREAEVTFDTDRTNIFNLISTSDGGFDALNSAIRTSLFLWLVGAGQELLQKVGGTEGLDANVPHLTDAEIDAEAARHSYGWWKRSMLRIVNKQPSLPVWLPLIAYLTGGIDCIGVGIYLDQGGRMSFALVAFALGIVAWASIGKLGMLLYHLRAQHQIRTPVVVTCCHSDWVVWLSGMFGAWLMWIVLLWLCFYFEEPRAIFLTTGIVFVFTSVCVSLYIDQSQRARLGMLSVRVGWLLLKLGRPEEATALFYEAHKSLLQVVGGSTPAGYLAAPGLVRGLQLLGRKQEAAAILEVRKLLNETIRSL